MKLMGYWNGEGAFNFEIITDSHEVTNTVQRCPWTLHLTSLQGYICEIFHTILYGLKPRRWRGYSVHVQSWLFHSWVDSCNTITIKAQGGSHQTPCAALVITPAIPTPPHPDTTSLLSLSIICHLRMFFKWNDTACNVLHSTVSLRSLHTVW